VLDPKPPLIDVWLKTKDDESFAACKRIIGTEGLFVGGSSGTALAGTLRYLHSEEGKAIAEDPSANVVVIFPDGVRNYMSKPWFLAQPENPEAKAFQDEIRAAIGRDLDDVYGTRSKTTAETNGTTADNATKA
jgi:cystathionine beta-synthase